MAKHRIDHRWRFKDLPNRPGITRSQCAISVAEAMQFLRKGESISAAGDAGALHVYKDRKRKDSKYHCNFQVRCIQQNIESFYSLAEVEKWLTTWFPKLGDQEKLAPL